MTALIRVDSTSSSSPTTVTSSSPNDVGASSMARSAYFFAIFGIRDYRKLFERNWFALKNFHCGYYEDSPELDRFGPGEVQYLEAMARLFSELQFT